MLWSNALLEKKKKGATFQPQGTGPAAESQSKKGQNEAQRTSCKSEGQDAEQTEQIEEWT